MKLITSLILLVLVSSCATRKTSLSKEKFVSVDKGVVERTAPGDFIVLPPPMTPKDRPRDTTKVYKGTNGAKAIINYDSDGYASGIFECPEVDELEKKNSELSYQVKEKQSERAFNEYFVREIKSTVIWMTVIVSATMLLRSLITRKGLL